MTMVSRMAKAIYEKRNGHGCKPWGQLPHDHQRPYLDDARAALGAAREPSEAMMVAGGLKAENMLFADDPDYTGVIFKDMGHVWRTMIDAALGDAVARPTKVSGSTHD